MNEKPKKGLQTVHRAISLLDCFTAEETELSLTRLTEKTKLPKSTTARIIDTLVEANILERNEHNLNYRLGYKIYLLGKIAEHSNNIIKNAAPIMKKLRDDTGESVALYKISGDKRLCVTRFLGPQAISHYVSEGTKHSLDVGASGKALLSFQEEYLIEKILNNQKSEERKKWLLSEIEEIRKTHISYSLDERKAGVNSVSSPIFNMFGKVNYVISVSGPSIRFTKEKMKSWGDRIRKDALAISNLLGYS